MNCHPSIFCTRAIRNLQQSDNFAVDFVKLKIQFIHEHQAGYIFSTRFGANFFDEVLTWIGRNDYLKPVDNKSELGEYDKNFNAWLKTARQTK